MAKRNSDQKCCKYIRALNSVSDERPDSIALFDGKRDYTYRRMFRRWELYAEVFSALDICAEHGSRAAITGNPSAETIMAYYALNMTGTSVSMVHMSDLRDPLRWERMVRGIHKPVSLSDAGLNSAAECLLADGRFDTQSEQGGDTCMDDGAAASHHSVVTRRNGPRKVTVTHEHDGAIIYQ